MGLKITAWLKALHKLSASLVLERETFGMYLNDSMIDLRQMWIKHWFEVLNFAV